jgi:hypothetical protein
MRGRRRIARHAVAAAAVVTWWRRRSDRGDCPTPGATERSYSASVIDRTSRTIR